MTLPNHSNYNCKVTTSNGEESLIYANWLNNEHQNFWKDWHCQVGTERFYIDQDLQVFSGECKNNYLGSILSDFEPLPNGTKCSRDRCNGCTDDLMTAKHHPDLKSD